MSEWVIVAIIGVVLLFSAKKLPDMARGLGQSMRIFKAETRGLREDDHRAGQDGGSRSAVAPGRAAGDGTTDGGPTPGGTAPDNVSEPRGGSAS